jgi:1-phosphatidylinositol-4-phosphate 5-kinase
VSGEHEPSVILKDNDIKYKIRLPRNTTENLLAQIRADAEFLYSIGVMDYSLLGTCRICAFSLLLQSS